MLSPAGSFICSAADFCLEADLADLAATAAALLTTMVRSGSGVSVLREKKITVTSTVIRLTTC